MPEQAGEATEQPAEKVQVPEPKPGIDINQQLLAQIVVAGLQQIVDNQRLSQNTLLAFQKDLFQGGQGELGTLIAAAKFLRATGGLPPATE